MIDGKLSKDNIKYLHDKLCVSKQCVRNIKYLTDVECESFIAGVCVQFSMILNNTYFNILHECNCKMTCLNLKFH